MPSPPKCIYSLGKYYTDVILLLCYIADILLVLGKVLETLTQNSFSAGRFKNSCLPYYSEKRCEPTYRKYRR